MEVLYQERLAERYETLAHHFCHGEVWEKAFVYLGKAGEKARQAYANQDAIAFYTQALAVSERIAPALDAGQRLPVYEGRGLVWMLLTEYDEAIADFHAVRDLARQSGQPQKEGEALCHLAHAHYLTRIIHQPEKLTREGPFGGQIILYTTVVQDHHDPKASASAGLDSVRIGLSVVSRRTSSEPPPWADNSRFRLEPPEVASALTGPAASGVYTLTTLNSAAILAPRDMTRATQS
jgi:hypothetical protein